MTLKNHGGPAFPCTAEQFNVGFSGISMRDYFAGKALSALIQIGQSLGSLNREELSADAYLFADAMLAESNK